MIGQDGQNMTRPSAMPFIAGNKGLEMIGLQKTEGKSIALDRQNEVKHYKRHKTGKGANKT